MAAQRLGIDPADCVVVKDTTIGLNVIERLIHFCYVAGDDVDKKKPDFTIPTWLRSAWALTQLTVLSSRTPPLASRSFYGCYNSVT
jgi:hypothetical protein